MVSVGNALMKQHLDADTPNAVRYFAYGSNMQSRQMRKRCVSVEFLSVAKLPGYKLAFTRYSNGWGGGVADIVESNGSEVYGVIYRLSEKDLEHLDRYEGYTPGQTADSNSYNRSEIDVQPMDALKASVRAWTYFATKQTEVHPPSARYLQQIIEGAISSGLPEIYIAHLRTIPSR